MRNRQAGSSRREFLGQVGLAGGTLGLLGLPAFNRPALAQECAPPGPPGTAVPWKIDCRPIRARRPASTLSASEVQLLRDAYSAMRALDTSDPADPRGFSHQANVHCWNCGASVQVHFSWQFFAWHRAYLYFHERILGSLVGNMELRLPYWDWEHPSHRRLPPAYATPGDAGNPLWNGTRGMDATDELPDEDVGEDVMDGVMTLASLKLDSNRSPWTNFTREATPSRSAPSVASFTSLPSSSIPMPRAP